MNKRRTIIAILLMILLTAFFIAVGYFANLFPHLVINSNDDVKAASFFQSLSYLDEYIASMQSRFSQKTSTSVELMSAALNNFISKDGYYGPEVFEDGLVIRLENNKIIYPSGTPFLFPNLNPALLQNITPITPLKIIENGKERQVLVTVKAINETLYYFDWAEMDDYYTITYANAYMKESVANLEKIYNSDVILFDPEEPEKPIYLSDSLTVSGTDPRTLWKMASEESPEITIDKTTYKAYYRSLDFMGIQSKALILMNKSDQNALLYCCIGITIAFILFGTLCLILVTSAGQHISHTERKYLKKESIRKNMFMMTLLNGVLLFLFLIGFQLFSNLTRVAEVNQESLEMMIDQLENNSKQEATYREDDETWYIFCARRIADLYAHYPELHTKDFLVTASKIIGTDYIMIFDENGEEVLSTNSYDGFTLGKEVPSSETFRFLTRGVDSIVNPPEPDLFLGDKRIQWVGSRMEIPGTSGYGALILAFDPQRSPASNIKQEFADYLIRVASDQSLSFIADSDSGIVLYSSNPELTGMKSDAIGLAGFDASTPTSLTSLEIYGKRYYSAFDQEDQDLCFYMTETKSVYQDILIYPVFATAAYFVIIIIICLFIMKTDEAIQNKIDADTTMLESIEGIYNQSTPYTDLSNQSRSKADQIFSLTQFLFMLIILLLIITPSGNDFLSTCKFILTGNWKRGINAMAFTAIIVLLVIVINFLVLKKTIMSLLVKMVNSRTETIIRLLSSLLNYISCITALFLGVAYLGVDTQFLATTASILTLAVSLGSRDLIADILSGLFIIFEDDFHVGDFIQVNGFTGKVIEIGVRSTRLMDSNQHIKIIDNQSVKNILNMSQDFTRFSINLNISNDEHLPEIEEMLKRELPKIGEEIPQILSGPSYSGIKEISYRRVKIGIRVICHQDDMDSVTKELNHRLVDLFNENGFIL